MTIEELKKLSNGKKDYDFSQRLKLKYMPYAEKCALVKSVVDNTQYVEVNGKQVYKRNTSGMLFVFTMQLIDKYTDIEFDKDAVVKSYDELMATGLMNQLMSQIPEEEVSILRGMLDMQRDDEEVNTRSLISFFETRSESLQTVLSTIDKAIEKYGNKTN